MHGRPCTLQYLHVERRGSFILLHVNCPKVSHDHSNGKSRIIHILAEVGALSSFGIVGDTSPNAEVKNENSNPQPILTLKPVKEPTSRAILKDSLQELGQVDKRPRLPRSFPDHGFVRAVVQGMASSLAAH